MREKENRVLVHTLKVLGGGIRQQIEGLEHYWSTIFSFYLPLKIHLPPPRKMSRHSRLKQFAMILYPQMKQLVSNYVLLKSAGLIA
jgi:hypothetical protein